MDKLIVEFIDHKCMDKLIVEFIDHKCVISYLYMRNYNFSSENERPGTAKNS